MVDNIERQVENTKEYTEQATQELHQAQEYQSKARKVFKKKRSNPANTQKNYPESTKKQILTPFLSLTTKKNIFFKEVRIFF